jgi:transposase
MPKVTTVTLTAEERAALEKASQYGTTPSFRLRCQAILLKVEKRTSLDVAQQLGCCEMSVNDWLKRYQQQGLAGLKVQKGRGRKAILQADTDLAAVRQAVQGSRQRLSLAKAELEQELGKKFGMLALKRFLKKTVADTNAFDEP